MQASMQYDLFEKRTELGDIKLEVKEVKKSADNVRRGIFKRHSEIMKIVLAQQIEIQELRDILNGRKNSKDISVKKKNKEVDDFFN
jgi:hypothetical protein